MNPDAPRGAFKHAVFDFDGTISLIREGWQQIMIPYFTEELLNTPQGKGKCREEMEAFARDFIYVLTGKQTIYQCIRLAEEVARFGGTPRDPQAYKDEYHRRLSVKIEDRIAGLTDGTQRPVDHVVPGSFDLLDALAARGVRLYLASGTDEVYVKQEAALLGVDGYFGKHVYGAQTDYKTFSKKMVIERIIRENDLHGSELLGFGDGYVEIENVKSVGGFACGVATDEVRRWGLDEWKRERLTRSGADIIIPDYTETGALMEFLFVA
ncbi:MAG: HAD family hydrolase [Kiritimatiellaeota bacterium]|nr:HAD family hydrolase [Kiritimatiellota bacterium]